MLEFRGAYRPPPPPIYRSPSPGNVTANDAAFSTQVGIDTAPLFYLNAAAGANLDNLDEINAFLNSATAGNPFTSNPGELNVIDPHDLSTTGTGQGQADSYTAERQCSSK